MNTTSPERTDHDAVVAAWITAGPRELPIDARYAITATAAETPQLARHGRWHLGQPRVRMAAFGAIALALVVSIAAGRLVMPPDGRVGTAATHHITLTEARLEVSFTEPAGLDVDVDVVDRVAGIGITVGGLSYVDHEEQRRDARGIVVADITGATFHMNSQPPPFHDAAGFFASLEAAGPSHYKILSGVSSTELSGRKAFVADVVGRGWAFLEMGGSSHVVDLSMPQRLIASDVGDRVVLVQIWAGRFEELDEWLPKANEILATMRIHAVER